MKRSPSFWILVGMLAGWVLVGTPIGAQTAVFLMGNSSGTNVRIAGSSAGVMSVALQ